MNKTHGNARTLFNILTPFILLAMLVSMVVLPSSIAQAIGETTIWADSGSAADIQDAIDALPAEGGTVMIPAGTYNLGGSIMMESHVSLQGQGIENTIIRTSDTQVISGNNLDDIRICSFHLYSYNYDGHNGISLTDCDDVRIDHMRIEGYGESQAGIYLLRCLNTVIDHNYIKNDDTLNSVNYGVVIYGDDTTYDATVTAFAGTDHPRNVFIEDNYFTGCRHAVASNACANYVFRHNTVENGVFGQQVDAHGGAWGSDKGSRWWEVYDNTISNPVSGQSSGAIRMRGGDGVVFNNDVSGYNYAVVADAESNMIEDYPQPYQIRAMYVWNNTYSNHEFTVAFNDKAEYLVHVDRDVFLSAMPGYTPYTYPHPKTLETPPPPPPPASGMQLWVMTSGWNCSDSFLADIPWANTDGGMFQNYCMTDGAPYGLTIQLNAAYPYNPMDESQFLDMVDACHNANVKCLTTIWGGDRYGTFTRDNLLSAWNASPSAVLTAFTNHMAWSGCDGFVFDCEAGPLPAADYYDLLAYLRDNLPLTNLGDEPLLVPIVNWIDFDTNTGLTTPTLAYTEVGSLVDFAAIMNYDYWRKEKGQIGNPNLEGPSYGTILQTEYTLQQYIAQGWPAEKLSCAIPCHATTGAGSLGYKVFRDVPNVTSPDQNYASPYYFNGATLAAEKTQLINSFGVSVWIYEAGGDKDYNGGLSITRSVIENAERNPEEDTTPPDAITDLAVTGTTSNSATLSWTAPGDDGSTGIAASYDIRYSTSAINESNWASATQATGEPAPLSAGNTQTFTVPNLASSTTYYFAIKTSDEVPNESDVSNSPSGTTQSPDTTAPAVVTNLAASSPTYNSVTLSWTASGDDGNTGTATSYDIRYSTSTITTENWASASQATGEPEPSIAGSGETFVVTGLAPETTYYFALKTSDEVPNESGLSNVPYETTLEQPSNPIKYEYVDTGDANDLFYGVNWKAQTFTTAGSHSVTKIRLPLVRSGNPSGDVAVSIRATDANGYPTGADLASGSIACSSISTSWSKAWYDIELGTGCTLDAATKYAIVMRAASADASNNIFYWMNTTGSYSGGWTVASSNSGASWFEIASNTWDADFENWGFSIQDNTPPEPITDLSTSDPTLNSITLNWTAPGDDGDTGTATTYDIRYSTATINESNWASATQAAGEPTPLAAGNSQSFEVTGLDSDTLYYFAIKTADEVPNWSNISNIASDATDAEATLVKYEDFTTSNAIDLFYGANWRAQAFIPQTTHTLKMVKLALSKDGNPTGNIVVSIRAADANGYPTGSDLATGSIACSAVPESWAKNWYEFDLGAGFEVQASTKYAIVFRAPNATDTDVMYYWINTTGGYSNGCVTASSNSGTSWFNLSSGNWDANFEEWGTAAESPVKFEYIDTGDAIDLFYGVNWKAQTFTTASAHTVTKIRLPLIRSGNPGGNMTVSIKATDGSGLPTGADLASGSIACSSIASEWSKVWYDIELGAGCNLNASTKYAIVLKAVSADASNYIYYWMDTTGSYSGGWTVATNNGGASWFGIASNAWDADFEVWGFEE